MSGLFVSRLLDIVAVAGIMQSLGALFVLFLLRVLLRRDWLAVLASVLVFAANLVSQGEARWIVAPIHFVSVSLYFLVLMRVGLVSSALAMIVVTVLMDFPVAFQTSAWYSSSGYAAIILIAGLALYGFPGHLFWRQSRPRPVTRRRLTASLSEVYLRRLR